MLGSTALVIVESLLRSIRSAQLPWPNYRSKNPLSALHFSYLLWPDYRSKHIFDPFWIYIPRFCKVYHLINDGFVFKPP